MHPNRRLAENLAADGHRIFPCNPMPKPHPSSKAPLNAHSFKDAAADARQWIGRPDSAIGIPTSWFWALDIDIDAGGLEAAQQRLADKLRTSWAEIERQCGLVVRSARGGLHLYWRGVAGVKIRTDASDIASGIDTRGHEADGRPTAYIIAPGSTLSDGSRYEIIRGDFKPLTTQTRGLTFLSMFGKREREMIAASTTLRAAVASASPTEWRGIVDAFRPAQRLVVPTPDDAEPMRRQAMADLDDAARRLTALADGRRGAIFRLACALAKYAAHGVLAAAEIESALLDAWAASGAAAKHGHPYAVAAIGRAIARGANDPLPLISRKFREEAGAHG